MAFTKRCDGSIIEGLPPFTVLLPFVMPTRTGSMIYYEQELDVTDTLAFVKSLNRELVKRREILTLFEVLICASVRSLALRPRANRFVSGGRYYQRNEISVNFVAKRELTDEGEEFNVKIRFDPFDTLETVARKVKRYVRKAVSGEGMANDQVVKTLSRLPNFVKRLVARTLLWLDAHNVMPADMIESDPCFCSVFLTNVGSFGLESPPYHHLFERGNCPIFISMGKVKTVNRLEADGSVAERKMLTLRYSFDDRIADGTYMGRTLAMVKDFVEHPERLSERPELDPGRIAELKLLPLPAEEPWKD